MHRQRVQHLWGIIHHVHTRATVNVGIDIRRAKLVGIPGMHASWDRLDGGDNSALHA